MSKAITIMNKVARKSPFRVLKDNKIALTKKERAIVMKAKAVWHSGPHGEAQSAVWKSVNNGKTTYVTNTHRAYNTAPSLLGAINRFHKFIKSTA